jgi:ABC-2 type transport system ATP-binding protein
MVHMTTNERIRLEHVSRHFKDHKVLQDITFSVPSAEIFGLLGPSGSGKTTLVKLIAGIDRATSGDVFVQGEQMPKLSVLSDIGYMAQSDALYAELTAQENLEFFATLFGLKRQDRKRRIHEVMELVDLTQHLKKQVVRYSGGMKRRLSLAVSLLHRPKLLILDEPTVGIDPVLRKAIWSKLNELSEEVTTIIVTTHVMDEADKCHRLGMLRDGRLIAVGSPAALKEQVGVTNLEDVFLHYGGALA